MFRSGVSLFSLLDNSYYFTNYLDPPIIVVQLVTEVVSRSATVHNPIQVIVHNRIIYM